MKFLILAVAALAIFTVINIAARKSGKLPESVGTILTVPERKPFGWPDDPDAACFFEFVFPVIEAVIRGDEVAVMRASFNNMRGVCKVLVTLAVPNDDFFDQYPFSFLVLGRIYGEGEQHAAGLVSCRYWSAGVVNFVLDRFGHYKHRFTCFMQPKDAVSSGVVVMCDEHAVIKVVDGIPHVTVPHAEVVKNGSIAAVLAGLRGTQL